MKTYFDLLVEITPEYHRLLAHRLFMVNGKVNINWLLTGEGVMFLPELRQDDEISISGIGNVGNRGGVRHFTVLPSELLPAEDNVENQEALKMYKILLLTKEQVLL